MYVTGVHTKTKSGEISHTCWLLRHSVREGSKVKTKTKLTPLEEKVVRMRHGLRAPDTLELEQVGQDDSVIAEEVQALRGTVGKLTGVHDLRFDVLNGRMTVVCDPEAVSDAVSLTVGEAQSPSK